jgi:hypothetical protein
MAMHGSKCTLAYVMGMPSYQVPDGARGDRVYIRESAWGCMDIQTRKRSGKRVYITHGCMKVLS